MNRFRLAISAFLLMLAVLPGRSIAQTSGDASPSTPTSQPLFSAPPTPPRFPPAASQAAAPPEVQPLPMIARSTRSVRTKQAIDLAAKFLLSQQSSNGSWNDMNNDDWAVGQTAIVTLALLSSGESRQSPPINNAIAFTRSEKRPAAAPGCGMACQGHDRTGPEQRPLHLRHAPVSG